MKYCFIRYNFSNFKSVIYFIENISRIYKIRSDNSCFFVVHDNIITKFFCLMTISIGKNILDAKYPNLKHDKVRNFLKGWYGTHTACFTPFIPVHT